MNSTHRTTLTAYVEWDEETGLYLGIVPGIHGAHTEGATLDELQENLREVLALCVDEGHLTTDDLPRFVGLQQVEVAV
jgi:predicted RNase H-like HicB family nuclease